jgi:short-subunit dehydrogenase
LVARNQERLDTLCKDLVIRGAARADCFCTDLNLVDQHPILLDEAVKTLGEIDIVLIAHGTLSNQAQCEQSITLTLAEIHTNALSVMSLLTPLANQFEAQKKGTIAVISSVAGDRGRQSNYVYGSAKAMLTVFLSGLRQRLHSSGVSVLTIKPGFVDTPMTIAFKKGLLWATPEKVATSIVKACDTKSGVLYVPGFWYFIMAIVQAVPEFIFKKLKL